MRDGTIRWARVERPAAHDLYLHIPPPMRMEWNPNISLADVEIERKIVRLQLAGFAFDCADYRPADAERFGTIKPGHLFKGPTPRARGRGWANLRVNLSAPTPGP